MNEIMRQRRRALEELANTASVLARLRTLLRDQDSYEPAALEQSANALLKELRCSSGNFAAQMSIFIALRCGRVNGFQPESE